MLSDVVNVALQEIRAKSKLRIYQTDFQAWKWDVLGFRTYEKMQMIGDTCLFGEKNRSMVKSANGTAKDLALDTPILTTQGWKTMETVEVGDFVFSEEGKPIRVSWKSEVFNKPSYRVLFDDGSYLVSSASHEWNTLTLNKRSHIQASDWRDHWDSSETVNTGEIRSTLGSGSKNHLIPLTRPVEFPEADLPLDPYVLGAWLGDGTSIRAEITCKYDSDGHVVDRFAAAGFPMTPSASSPYRWTAILDSRGERGSKTSRLALLLKQLGVMGKKHIPDSYMFSGVNQRIELVRGLMDTDGTADKRGAMVAFSQSDPDLIGQFCDILTSLGVRFSISAWQPTVGKLAYTVQYRPWFDPFTPGSRKSEIFAQRSNKQASRLTGRTIVAVEEVESVPTQCIQVDSERHLYLAGSGLIPTHNSFEVSLMVAWSASVFDPGETVSIISAPSVPQLEKVIFKYLKSHYNRSIDRNMRLPGRIDESLGWVYDSEAGKGWLAFARKPPEQDAVSVFQGVRSEFGRTNVFFDEAGGMSRAMFTAAEAVLTGADARFVGIGNPDNTGTEFQRIFTDPKLAAEYNLFTIAAQELPTLTGERVYPRTPEGDEMEAKMLKSLTQRDWVEHKKRIWGESDARYLSKVLGEFPPDSGSVFFGQQIINLAHETTIDPEGIRPVLGVDIARYGQDESVIYQNRGGHVRLVDSWGKTDTVTTAKRIHENAKRLGALEVRIDASGIGGGVFDMLEKLPEFEGKPYLLIGIDGGTASPDSSRWANSRAYNHDFLRTEMAEGRIDLDFEDEDLKDQLLGVTYKFNNRGAIQITPKDEMKTVMDGSPDRLDSCIYSVVDLEWLTGNPIAQMKKGDIFQVDNGEFYSADFYDYIRGAGMPIL